MEDNQANEIIQNIKKCSDAKTKLRQNRNEKEFDDEQNVKKSFIRLKSIDIPSYRFSISMQKYKYHRFHLKVSRYCALLVLWWTIMHTFLQVLLRVMLNISIANLIFVFNGSFVV